MSLRGKNVIDGYDIDSNYCNNNVGLWFRWD